eukprot:9739618-Karenia_brevis.AAC.2
MLAPAPLAHFKQRFTDKPLSFRSVSQIKSVGRLRDNHKKRSPGVANHDACALAKIAKRGPLFDRCWQESQEKQSDRQASLTVPVGRVLRRQRQEVCLTGVANRAL